ncbi:probable RNA-binding protein 19 [Neocloeon triangulifer]|uniref:probable RNA-binding protein 19 n=1 Tax=Neocloeon triangulifer TaxID=2078957 RepID=UPI00286F747B|nr:probable RNA-binding protein 19 [Neocloeon triangulifer]
MSRLIVKNLANSVSAEKIRKSFGSKGVITDVQLKFTKDGKFRHFGFVGFKNPEEAQAAKEFFDGTFINGTKIQVEVCADLGDSNKPQAWSKYAPDSAAYKKAHGEEKSTDQLKKPKEEKKKKKESKNKELIEKHKDDPLFAEFLETHGKTLEELVETEPEKEEESKTADEANEGVEEDAVEKEANKKISDLEYLQSMKEKSGEETQVKPPRKKMEKIKKQVLKNTLFTVKLRGLAFKHKKKDIKQFFDSLKPKSVRLCSEIKGIAYVGFNTEKEMKQALNKNKSFLDGKRLLVTLHSLPKTNNEEVAQEKWSKQEESLKNEETIAESGCIFVRNLAYTTSQEDLEPLFSKYGPLTEISVPVDKTSRKMKGFACVTFMVPENAVRAYTELDGTAFQGRMMHLLPGKTKKSFSEMAEEEGLTFKQKQALKKKAQSSSSHNWNTLFLGQNAVVDAMARTYNTTKEQVLDMEGSDSVAVRLALGETQIVHDTKQFLEQNGVCLDAFNQAPKSRSKNVILAKNLPAGTTSEELQEIFEKHGELGRLLLPPSGVSAIIEFCDPSEAKTAFTKLAYTKFKHLPLYLEWAPEETFSTQYVKKLSKKKVSDGKLDKESSSEEISGKQEAKNEDKDESDNDESIEPENDTTLFIKNLNFSTTEDRLKEHFAKCGKLASVSIAKKKDTKNAGKMLSMGYGFIQYIKKSDTDKALKTLQHSMLDNHAIELKRSNRTAQGDVATARKKASIGKQTGSKIIVRNIPFQATQQEIRELFKVFGELKAVRLPRKMVGTGPHRGFAFVEYTTKGDAKRAFEALCQSTHLYGRRLVLEWAAPEETIDELRKRTAQHFFNDQPAKKSMKSVLQMDLSNKDETED